MSDNLKIGLGILALVAAVVFCSWLMTLFGLSFWLYLALFSVCAGFGLLFGMAVG